MSGSYNINLQIVEMNFWYNRITILIYKIIKISRVIRSQNAYDGGQEWSGGLYRVFSFETVEIDSNHDNVVGYLKQKSIKKMSKKAGVRPMAQLKVNEILFDEV